MVLCLQFPLLPFNKKQPLLSSSSLPSFHTISCLSTASAASSSPARRTANYQPTIWDDSYIQSLPIEFMEENNIYQRDKLKAEVRCLIGQQHGLVKQLELVDSICQLGLGYHFDLEIKNLLSSLSSSMENTNNLIENNNLQCFALLFRLVREHCITNAPLLSINALIDCIKKEKENGNPNHQYDVKGMLSLYEASYFTVEGEEELDEAGEFATEYLRYLDKSLLNPQLVEKIEHSLEIPLHWRVPRMHARWFIDAYGRQENANPTLLELAKLDFNMLQSIYKIELQEISRWWTKVGLVCDELTFARDRLVENYVWALGFKFQPEFWRSRKAITKIICLSTILDDIYDIYGTLDELKPFTNAIEEWKMAATQQLPDYMKIYLNILFNTMNDIATSFSKEKELDILPCLKEVWADLCKAHLVEARWYHNGYTPTLDEYLENAWVTIAGITPIITLYCLNDDLTIEALNNLEFYPPIVRHSCILLRLYDDLGTATAEIERGDVLKSIQCYMKEKNVSESVARDYIRCLIRIYWKKLNQDCITFSKSMEYFKKSLVDMPRTAQCFYQYGDGYGEPNHETRDQIIGLIIEPIPL